MSGSACKAKRQGLQQLDPLPRRRSVLGVLAGLNRSCFEDHTPPLLVAAKSVRGEHVRTPHHRHSKWAALRPLSPQDVLHGGSGTPPEKGRDNSKCFQGAMLSAMMCHRSQSDHLFVDVRFRTLYPPNQACCASSTHHKSQPTPSSHC